MGAERRIATRRDLHPIEISGFTSIDHQTLISRKGQLVEASKTGFLIRIQRKDLVPKNLRESLSMESLVGDQVFLKINPMDLEIGGKIVRTKRITKTEYEIAIDYSGDAPEYWREALFDMLPTPGEMD